MVNYCFWNDIATVQAETGVPKAIFYHCRADGAGRG